MLHNFAHYIMLGRTFFGGSQKRMRSVMLETEEEASIAYDLKTPVVSSIINERSQNKWGIPQGYRIQVLSPPPSQVVASIDDLCTLRGLLLKACCFNEVEFFQDRVQNGLTVGIAWWRSDPAYTLH